MRMYIIGELQRRKEKLLTIKLSSSFAVYKVTPIFCFFTFILISHATFHYHCTVSWQNMSRSLSVLCRGARRDGSPGAARLASAVKKPGNFGVLKTLSQEQ